MTQVATRRVDQSPAIAPATSPIDRGHLTRMTLDDPSLEREVLQLFDRQAATLVARMRTASPAAVPALAHTLKGSACSIGAWHVARAAEAVELADGAPTEAEAAHHRVAAAVDEARSTIAELLRAHQSDTIKSHLF